MSTGQCCTSFGPTKLQSVSPPHRCSVETSAMGEQAAVSKPVSAIACIALASLYVAILYAPTLILRLPPASSFKDFMVRRFICAIISTILSLLLSALILPVQIRSLHGVLGVYGIRMDHMFQAVVFPLALTALMYTGSLFRKCLSVVNSWKEYRSSGGSLSFDSCRSISLKLHGWLSTILFDIQAWRNFIVAPLTEELVFRACMIPLLLCGGLKTYSIILLCPIFFSLAHLNHFMEIYSKQNYNIIRASVVIGIQLGYTVVFGSYASFLFIRTGHLVAPLVAHIYCNLMGLPAVISKRHGMVTLAFIMGFLGFLWLLFPMTRPDLYNDRIDNCSCWQGYCSWTE